MKFCFIDKEVLKNYAHIMNQRFSSFERLPVIRSHHCFIPMNNRMLKLLRVSGDDDQLEVSTDQREEVPANVDLNKCEPGKYLCVLYDGFWWVGIIQEVLAEHGDILVSFMHSHGPAKSLLILAKQ